MRRALAAASAALLALTACSSSGGGGGTPLTDKAGLTAAGATKSLLTESQLPQGLSVNKGDTTELPLPCTPKVGSVDKQYHPRATARVTFEDALGSFQITEIVSNYPGLRTALAVSKTFVNGLGCETGYLHGRFAVTISKPQDLTKLGTPVDDGALWSLQASGAEQVVIVARIGTQIVQLLFASTGAVRGGVDPAAIAKTAVAKVNSTIHG